MDEVDRSRPPPVKPAANGTPLRRALLVCADMTTQQVCRAALESAGFTVDREDSGMGAVMSARAAQPQLIVVDQQLRDVTGGEAIGWLRSNPELATAPIIMLTTSAADDETAVGAHGSALRKPLSQSALRRAIRGALA
jgi:CheY-like chemotaxis protein